MAEQLANLERKYKVLENDINEINKISKLTPEKIRGFRYDIYWDAIEAREPLIEQDQEYLNKQKVILQKQQEEIDKINILYDEMKKKLNEIQTGNLKELAGQTIKKNNIIPNEGDEIGQHVLDLHQSYNEAAGNRNNNIGGKKRRIKNKTHKKRKNKNKNSRRFIINK